MRTYQIVKGTEGYAVLITVELKNRRGTKVMSNGGEPLLFETKEEAELLAKDRLYEYTNTTPRVS